MARSYSRDSQGQFSSKRSKGDKAETIQQNKAKKDDERRKKKEDLSGNKVGGGKKKRVSRAATVGVKATTRAAKNSLARARRRMAT